MQLARSRFDNHELLIQTHFDWREAAILLLLSCRVSIRGSGNGWPRQRELGGTHDSSIQNGFENIGGGNNNGHITLCLTGY